MDFATIAAAGGGGWAGYTVGDVGVFSALKSTKWAGDKTTAQIMRMTGIIYAVLALLAYKFGGQIGLEGWMRLLVVGFLAGIGLAAFMGANE